MGTLWLPGVRIRIVWAIHYNNTAKECCDSVTDTGYELVCLIIYYQQFLNINLLVRVRSSNRSS